MGSQFTAWVPKQWSRRRILCYILLYLTNLTTSLHVRMQRISTFESSRAAPAVVSSWLSDTSEIDPKIWNSRIIALSSSN